MSVLFLIDLFLIKNVYLFIPAAIYVLNDDFWTLQW